jgi:general L-amino acid transport system substrate-binding protein
MPDEDAPGLSEASEEGRFNGLAADICRALAAAALGDADAVVFEPVGAARARAALADGTVDLLSLTPVATDTETLTPTVAYARPLFFDGLGLLAPLGVEAASIRELRGVAICVEGGSDEERALAASFLAAGERLTTVVYHSAAAALAGYDEEESCTALAGRRGELAGIRRSLIVPEGSAVLDLALTREPWAPALPPDDPQWAELVELVLGGLIEAERLAIDAATVASGTEDATVRELFFRNQQARQLGLDTDALAQVIAAVGNYGEIYARNLGPETAASLPRSANGVVVENDGP